MAFDPDASDASAAPSSPARPAARTHTKTFTTHMYHDDDDSRLGDREKGARKSKNGPRDPNQSMIGKVKHLKKEDGDPLWRKDIQYDFLKAIFDDETKVFRNSYEPDRINMQCFADLYIDTMARSSKTSKVLRDKLLSDREAAKGMAMVCLLVNIGRMNTTLNCMFFPLCFYSYLPWLIYYLLAFALVYYFRLDPLCPLPPPLPSPPFLPISR